MEVKNYTENNEVKQDIDYIDQVASSNLPDKIKKKLINSLLETEKEAGLEIKQILKGVSKQAKEYIANKFQLSVSEVDKGFVNGLKNLPENKEKVVDVLTKKVLNNQKEVKNLIKNPHTYFIDVKGSYTQVEKNTSLENKGWVGPVYDYLGDPDFTINDVPVYKEQLENVNTMLYFIKNSNNYEDFLNNIKVYIDLDSLLTGKSNSELFAERLQALSYIGDINLYDSKMFTDPYNAANNALSEKYSPEQYFNILKASVEQGKHIDATTCIQLHTFLAKAWKDAGFGDAITSTVDIGVAHRLAILQDKNSGKLYLISDGLLLEGKSYKELISLFPGRFVLQHFLYNSDNKQIGRIQTDSEKQVTENISGYSHNFASSYGEQSFISKILSKENLSDLHRKNVVKLEYGNVDKSVYAQHTFDDGGFVSVKATDNYIPGENTKVKSVSVGIGGGTDNWDGRVNFGKQWIEKPNIYGPEKEQVYHFYAGLLAATDTHYFANSYYYKLAASADWGMTFEGEGLPITNAEGNIAVGAKIGKKFENGDVYIKGTKSLKIESATSLNSDTQVLKPTIRDDGYLVGVGGKYNEANFFVGGEINYHKDKISNTITTELTAKKGDLAASLRYSKTNYDTSILAPEEQVKIQIAKKINDNWQVYSGYERNKEDGYLKTNKVYAGIKVEW